MRLLEMSISAGALILFLALLRTWDFWNLPKRTVRALWLVALARLLLPVSLPMQGKAFSPLHLLQKMRHLWQDAGGSGRTVSGAMPKAASFGVAEQLGSSFSQAIRWIWVAGMACAGIYFLYFFLKEYRLLAQALPLESMPQSESGKILEDYRTAVRLAGVRLKSGEGKAQILVHDRIQSPLVFGVLRQRIVLPKSMLHLGQAQMRHVLTHEMVHIKRWDNLWKLLSAAALCIHWPNPLVWLMYLLFARDLETSCDEQVLAMYGSQGRQEYAMTLLTLAQNQKETTLFCSGFGRNPIKERIVAIMKFRKLSGIGILCSVMLVAGASSVFATNAPAAQAEDGQPKIEKIEELQEADLLKIKFDKPIVLPSGNEMVLYYCVDEDGNAQQMADGQPKVEKIEEAQDVEVIKVDFDRPVEFPLDGNRMFECVDSDGNTFQIQATECSQDLDAEQILVTFAKPVGELAAGEQAYDADVDPVANLATDVEE